MADETASNGGTHDSRGAYRRLFGHVDGGHGWLILGLPPSEFAVHPATENGRHELYLMYDDLDAEMARLAASGVALETPVEEDWGRVTRITPPGGGLLGLYEPHHARR